MTQANRILCVDDDKFILKRLKTCLGFSGYEVTTCQSPEEALKILNSDNSYAMIITDYYMEHMDGINLLQTAQRRWPEIVRVIISGQSDSHHFVPAIFEEAIQKYVSKPWDNKDLVKTVSLLLNRYRSPQKDITPKNL